MASDEYGGQFNSPRPNFRAEACAPSATKQCLSSVTGPNTPPWVFGTGGRIPQPLLDGRF